MLLKHLKSEWLKDPENEDKHQAYSDYLWARCATDIELFTISFFSHFLEDDFNEFHREHFDSYQWGKRQIRRTRGAPRGYAKSTLKALIQPIHDLCYGQEKYILIFSNTGPQADEKLGDIRTELLNNKPLIDFYGISFATRSPAKTSYVASSALGEVKFEGYGAGAEVRGLRFGTWRPTKIIFDDVEHSDEVESEALRERLLRRYNDVYLKLGTKRHTNIEFVGTVLHRQSLLKTLLANPMYDAKMYQAILSWSENEGLWEQWRDILRNHDDPNRFTSAQQFYDTHKVEMLAGTKVLWPERESYYDLMLELFETGRRSFFKEKQNNPLGDEEKVFDLTRVRWYKEELRDGKIGALIEATGIFLPFSDMECVAAMDPATGQTKPNIRRKSDYTAMLTGYKHMIETQNSKSSPRLFVHHAHLKRESPSRSLDAMFDLIDTYNHIRFGFETNLYRNLLSDNISAKRTEVETRLRRKINTRFYEIENVENKEKRIYSIEPKVDAGYILMNRALHPEFLGQLEDFPKGDHDDGPDALEMLWGMVNNKYQMSPISLGVQGRV